MDLAKAHVAVVAMVLDTATGRVMNADKCYLDKTPTAVERISTSEKTETARYNAAGQRLDAPQQGLNMVRFSDGTVRGIVGDHVCNWAYPYIEVGYAVAWRLRNGDTDDNEPEK